MADVPEILRDKVTYTERHTPHNPAEAPDLVQRDPAWLWQWEKARNLYGTWEGGPPSWPEQRRTTYARWLAVTGHIEHDLIVSTCAFAASSFDLPVLWRMALMQQAHDDMNHAESYIRRACILGDTNYWEGVPTVNYRDNIRHVQAIARRDLGGFFAAVALHTEAYPAQVSPVEAIMLDPVMGRWLQNEIAEEAAHLSFLLPAFRAYLNPDDAELADARKRQLVRDNEVLRELILEKTRINTERFLVGRLDVPPSILDGFTRIDARTSYIFAQIGLEPSYLSGSR
jgi:hypothetical protein